jgi:hypothetical protein
MTRVTAAGGPERRQKRLPLLDAPQAHPEWGKRQSLARVNARMARVTAVRRRPPKESELVVSSLQPLEPQICSHQAPVWYLPVIQEAGRLGNGRLGGAYLADIGGCHAAVGYHGAVSGTAGLDSL